MPEHTIAENLTRLQNAKTAIGTAITAKGGTVAAGDGLEEFAADIATIPSGTTLYKLITNDVNVWDSEMYCYVDETYGIKYLIIFGWFNSDNGQKEFLLSDGLTFGDLGVTNNFTILVGSFIDSYSSFYYLGNDISPTSNKIIIKCIGGRKSVVGTQSFT